MQPGGRQCSGALRLPLSQEAVATRARPTAVALLDLLKDCAVLPWRVVRLHADGVAWRVVPCLKALVAPQPNFASPCGDSR